MKTTYTTDDGDLVIEFDYQPYEPATHHDPHTPESADVYSVMAGNFEILDWCSDASITFFEEKCLEAVAFARECSEIDRADARSEA
jgi:hypothetical protein